MFRDACELVRGRSLEAEIIRRAEADKALAMKFDAEIKAMEERFALHMREVQAGIKTSIDGLGRTFGELRSAMREEREARHSELQQAEAKIDAKLEELQGAVDDERVTRLEREAQARPQPQAVLHALLSWGSGRVQTLKRIGEDVFRMQEKVEAERQSMLRLQNEVASLQGGRSALDERFQAAVLQELSILKNGIEVRIAP